MTFDALTLVGSIIFSFAFGLLVGAVWKEWWWRGEMVQRGHARYHFYDGKWYWNEDMPKPTDPAAYRAAKIVTRRNEAIL